MLIESLARALRTGLRRHPPSPPFLHSVPRKGAVSSGIIEERLS